MIVRNLKFKKGEKWTPEEISDLIISCSIDGLIKIDLTGPKGNAYYLMSIVSDLSEKLGYDKEKIIEEMKSSDYENLIQVVDKYFGNIVVMYI